MDFVNLDDEARKLIGEVRRRSLMSDLDEHTAQAVEAVDIALEHGVPARTVYDAIRGTELPPERPEQPKPLSLNHAEKSGQYYAQLTQDEMKAVDEFEQASVQWTPRCERFNEAREKIAEMIMKGR